MKSLPFRISLQILHFVYDDLELNIDKEGKVYQYKEEASKENFEESSSRTYFTQSEVIRTFYGYFSNDRYRKFFLLYSSISFHGERFIGGCTYMNFPLTLLDEKKLIPIPRKVVCLEISNLGFCDLNLPNGDKMEFLKELRCYGCQIDNFESTVSFLASNRLLEMTFSDITSTSKEEQVNKSFLPMFVKLEYLSFTNCSQLPGEVIRSIVSFKGPSEMKSLTLSFKNSILDPFFETFSLPIKTLDISNSQVSDRICEYISQHQFLESLRMFSCNITFRGVVHLLKPPKIKSLTIGENSVKFENLENEDSFLESLKTEEENNFQSNLRELHIVRNYNNAPSNEFFEFISKTCRRLEKLNLYEDEINDFLMRSICRIGSLKVLNLDYNSVTRASVPEMARLEKLEYLNICGTDDFGDEDLRILVSNSTSKLKHLKTLNISLTKVTDAVVQILKDESSVKSLREINVHYTKMTKEGVEELKNVERIERIIFGSELGVGANEYWCRDENESCSKYF